MNSMQSNKHKKLIAIVGAASCLQACALPRHAEDLTKDQQEILAEMLGDKADAELELLNNLLPAAIPLVDSAGNATADNTELLQDMAAATEGLRDFLAQRRIKTLNVNNISEIGVERAVAAAHGTATATDIDNYVIIITGDDGQWYLRSVGELVHEWFHFTYGGHSAEVAEAVNDGDTSYIDFQVFLQEQDVPYIVSTTFRTAEYVWPESTTNTIAERVEYLMNRIAGEIQSAIEHKNAADADKTDEAITQTILQGEYDQIQQALASTQEVWADDQAQTSFGDSTIVPIFEGLEIIEDEYRQALEQSPKMFNYWRRYYEKILEAFLETYGEYFEQREVTENQNVPRASELKRARNTVGRSLR